MCDDTALRRARDGKLCCLGDILADHQLIPHPVPQTGRLQRLFCALAVRRVRRVRNRKYCYPVFGKRVIQAIQGSVGL